MSYGFHSSERIKRRRTKISIHVRSRSHSVTVAPFPRNLHVAACARFGLNLESDRGYLRPCNELSTECSFWQWAALSRGLSRTLTRLPSTRLNCSSITASNISSLFFQFCIRLYLKSNSIGNFYYYTGNRFEEIFFGFIFFRHVLT